MGRSRYKFHESHFPYFITSTIVEGYSLFADPNIADILLQSLRFLQEERGVILFAYVIMHNHLHIIAEHENLQSMKSFTARKIIDYLKESNKTRTLKKLQIYKQSFHKDSDFQVWQEGLHPKQIHNCEIMYQKIDYIHQNPVKAGFVEASLYWRYSSALNYEGKKGLIPVSVFDF